MSNRVDREVSSHYRDAAIAKSNAANDVIPAQHLNKSIPTLAPIASQAARLSVGPVAVFPSLPSTIVDQGPGGARATNWTLATAAGDGWQRFKYEGQPVYSNTIALGPAIVVAVLRDLSEAANGSLGGLVFCEPGDDNEKDPPPCPKERDGKKLIGHIRTKLVPFGEVELCWYDDDCVLIHFPAPNRKLEMKFCKSHPQTVAELEVKLITGHALNVTYAVGGETWVGQRMGFILIVKGKISGTCKIYQYVKEFEYSREPGATENTNKNEKDWQKDAKNPQDVDSFDDDGDGKSDGFVFSDLPGPSEKKIDADAIHLPLRDGYVAGHKLEFETFLVCDNKIVKCWKWCFAEEWTIKNHKFQPAVIVGEKDCEPTEVDPAAASNTSELTNSLPGK